MTMPFFYPLSPAPGPLSLRQEGGLPSLSMVGCRTGANGEFSPNLNFSNTNFFELVQTRHILPYGADYLAVVYAGFVMAGNIPYPEIAVPPAVWRVANGTLIPSAGGSGYAAGDTVTGPTGTTIPAPWIGRVLAVNSGAITKIQVLRPGIYTGTAGPPADPMSQSATSGGGTAATFNAQWEGFATAAHLSITPTFANPVLNGVGALELLRQGSNYGDMTDSWDCYIPSGDIWMSDVIPVDIAPGTAIGLRGELIGANSNCGRACITSEFCATGTSFTFERANTTTNIGASQANQLMQPVAIMGIPKIVGPTLLIIGDSRLQFNGPSMDPMDTDGNSGWMERATLSQMPFSSWSRSSFRLANYINITPPALGRSGLRRVVAALRPTAVYFNLTINDLVAGGTSAATLQTWEVQMLQMLRGLGVQQIFTDTTEPNTTSSDSWATLANQTISAGGLQAIIRNAALRAGGYPGSGQAYDFFFDNQGISEDNSTGTPSGKWIPNTTVDGMHGNQAVLLAKAARAAPLLQSNLTVR